VKLQSRAARPQDIEQCLALLGDRFLYDEASLKNLGAMWLEILAHDIGCSGVVFEDGRPCRVLAFGFSVAIESARFEAIRAGCAPGIARRLLDDWRAGKQPFLDEAAFSSANASEGVTILGAHQGIVATSDLQFASAVGSTLVEAFTMQHAGLNIKALANEIFGMLPTIAADFGMTLRFDYPPYEADLASMPIERRPFLVTMTREEAEKHPGNLLLNRIFLQFSPRRFALTAPQTRLLRYALEGGGDLTIAEILNVSPATLKKRWARIYEAMEAVIGSAAGGEDGHRGRPRIRRSTSLGLAQELISPDLFGHCRRVCRFCRVTVSVKK
jgi:hypothetical protein